MQVPKPTGRPQPVIFARRFIFIAAFMLLGACIEAATVPDWVLVCHDTGGGAQCPPRDTDAEAQGPSAVDIGPSEARGVSDTSAEVGSEG